ncbi:beta-1 adrenergic receptor-like [Patiria miniata]|uniref:G-protein coupled receptors family 1 profile domain-containing protein n=1 Tax=Patiria miniata TaxID=46514 RepID=A0A914B5T6_PATMI|nr:beta-1 adrenergic receptor-like [Patiria miniata]
MPNTGLIAARTAFILSDAITIFVANIISIAVTWKTREIAEMTKIFATSLAVADLSVGILISFSLIPSAVDRWLYGDVMCRIIGVMGPSFAMISTLSLLCVSADRYLAVTRPLRYYGLMTRRRAGVALAAVWLSTIGANTYVALNSNLIIYDRVLCVCLPEWGNQEILAYLVTICSIWIAVPSILTIFFYAQLFRISRRHARQIAAQGAPANGPRSADMRAIRTMFIVTGAFNLAYMPFLFCNIYLNISTHGLPDAVKFCSMWLLLSNSWWNFFIYLATSKNFRRTAFKLLCRKCPGALAATNTVESADSHMTTSSRTVPA